MSIEVARNIAVTALLVVLIATWLVRTYGPDDDETKSRCIQVVLLRLNIAVGFIAWSLSVLADPEHLGRNLSFMAVGLGAVGVFAGGRRPRQQRRHLTELSGGLDCLARRQRLNPAHTSTSQQRLPPSPRVRTLPEPQPRLEGR